MKLLEALKISNAPQHGPELAVLLASGFTPLHLETVLKAHLRLRFPGRTVVIKTGLFENLPATLEIDPKGLGAALIAIEWADLDLRLGWRGLGAIEKGIVADARIRLEHIASAIEVMAQHVPVAISFPTLPLAPGFETSNLELNRIEAQLWEMLFRFAALTPAAVVRTSNPDSSAHDLRSELMNGFPYSFVHAEKMARALIDVAFPRPPKKGLITDLDETLWSGTLGEDGPEGISWDLDHKTHFYALYQQLLNSLAAAGTLLGVASKNDENLVKQAFERSDLVIEPVFLFPVEAHWNPKPESVARTLERWNIGADTVVFVDDNEWELEQVKQAFPGLECILFRRDDPSFLRELRDWFAKREIRQEDVLRIKSVREGRIVQEAAALKALDSLLQGAEANIILNWAKQPLDPRALELVNKTNQFNLNGIRYEEAEWRQFIAQPSTRLLVVGYQDRFSKLGKIAVLAGYEIGNEFSVETWVMSCRAFSRRIEHQVLMALFERWDQVTLRFERTQRNAPFENFLNSLGAGLSITRQEYLERCPALFHKTEVVHA